MKGIQAEGEDTLTFSGTLWSRDAATLIQKYSLNQTVLPPFFLCCFYSSFNSLSHPAFLFGASLFIIPLAVYSLSPRRNRADVCECNAPRELQTQQLRNSRRIHGSCTKVERVCAEWRPRGRASEWVVKWEKEACVCACVCVHASEGERVREEVCVKEREAGREVGREGERKRAGLWALLAQWRATVVIALA